LDPAVQTASGEVASAPLVLIDLLTEEGVTGRSYIFCYTPVALRATWDLVSRLEDLLRGDAVAPLAIESKLAARFRLLGREGLTGMAIAGVDMAAWDALARAARLPLVRLLGGEPRPVPAYGSLRTMDPLSAAKEAAQLAELGFAAYKVKVGLAGVETDLEVIHALRSALGDGVALAVDYNQCLSVPEAIHRARALEKEGLFWIEEPTTASDFAGHARIAREVHTPIQIGENWWGLPDMAKSVAAGASDHGMPDAMKIGGVTGWLRAVTLAEAAALPLSSHIFPEISAHLLAVTPTAHLLEYLDVAAAILQEPLRVENGHVLVPSAPGIGLEWDEDAVARFLIG
ncbi:MAG TPA: enolase C-terminal domain-like protein, partial [Acidimicrobiia bacterium]|nr:enolase C-terminal domain-like protein [Acidimicrobiia bacterium]